MAQAKIRLSGKEVAKALGQVYGVKVTGLRPFYRVGESGGVLTVQIEALSILCEPSPSAAFAELVARQARTDEKEQIAPLPNGEVEKKHE